MQECRHAGMKPLDLIWVDTDKSVDPTRKKIPSRLCAGEYKTKKQGNIQRALLASQLFSAMPPLESVNADVSIMMSVSFVEQRVTIEVETLRHQQSAFPRNSPRGLIYIYIYIYLFIRLPAEDRQKYGEVNVGKLIKSTCGTLDDSHFWRLDYANLICGESGGFRRGQHSTSLFHNPNQDVVNGRCMVMILCVCQEVVVCVSFVCVAPMCGWCLRVWVSVWFVCVVSVWCVCTVLFFEKHTAPAPTSLICGLCVVCGVCVCVLLVCGWCLWLACMCRSCVWVVCVVRLCRSCVCLYGVRMVFVCGVCVVSVCVSVFSSKIQL